VPRRPGRPLAAGILAELADGDYDALDRQYQELFVVPLGRYVTPYEAVYRRGEPLDRARTTPAAR